MEQSSYSLGSAPADNNARVAFTWTAYELWRLRHPGRSIVKSFGWEAGLPVGLAGELYLRWQQLQATSIDWWRLRFFASTAVFFMIVIARSVHQRRFPVARAVDLSVMEAGLAGTVGRTSTTLAWRAIVRAEMRTDAIRLKLDASPFDLWIPKRALDDPSAFWALLSEKLVGRRGLLPGPVRQRVLRNSIRRRSYTTNPAA